MNYLFFGLYNENDKDKFIDLINKSKYFECFFDIELHEEDTEGLKKLKKHLKNECFCLIDFKSSQNINDPFLITNNINSYYSELIKNNNPIDEPYFFELIDLMKNSDIDKFIILFFEYFGQEPEVRIEHINPNYLKTRLLNGVGWNEVYLNLNTQNYHSYFDHPLVLVVDNQLKNLF